MNRFKIIASTSIGFLCAFAATAADDKEIYGKLTARLTEVQVNLDAYGQSENAPICYTVRLTVGDPRGPYSTGSSPLNIGATMTEKEARRVLGYLSSTGCLSRMNRSTDEYRKKRGDPMTTPGIYLGIQVPTAQPPYLLQWEVVLPWDISTIDLLEGMQKATEDSAHKTLDMFKESVKVQRERLVKERKVAQQQGGGDADKPRASP